MIGKIIFWIKQNKFTAVLLLIVAYFFFRSSLLNLFSVSRGISSYQSYDYAGKMAAPSLGSTSLEGIGGAIRNTYLPSQEAAPAPDVENRMIVQTSHMSLLVKEVASTLKTIKNYASSIGGYMVNTNLSNPQEAASGNITLRIPQAKLEESLEYFRSLAVKVTSEKLDGRDVTDEYVDIDAKLKTLLANKARFEEIMAKTEKIEEILKIQEKIFSLQDQIDKLKGQQNYLEQTAKMAKMTIYLSTDEFALPYAPTPSWRPNVIFKRAVRSLVRNIQNLGTLAIWVLVYSAIWLPILVIIIYLRRRKKLNPVQTINN